MTPYKKLCVNVIFEPTSHPGAAGFNVIGSLPILGKLGLTLVGGALGSLENFKMISLALDKTQGAYFDWPELRYD